MNNNKPKFSTDEQAAYVAGCAGVLDAIAVAAGPDGAVVLTSSTELPDDAVAVDYQAHVAHRDKLENEPASDAGDALDLVVALRPLVLSIGESSIKLWPRDVLLAYHHARAVLAAWDRRHGVDGMPAVDPDESIEIRRVV
jgi:hypothetical protein